MSLEKVSSNKTFGGELRKYKFDVRPASLSQLTDISRRSSSASVELARRALYTVQRVRSQGGVVLEQGPGSVLYVPNARDERRTSRAHSSSDSDLAGLTCNEDTGYAPDPERSCFMLTLSQCSEGRHHPGSGLSRPRRRLPRHVASRRQDRWRGRGLGLWHWCVVLSSAHCEGCPQC